MSEKTFDNNTYTDSWEIKDAADGAAYSFETTQQVSDALPMDGKYGDPITTDSQGNAEVQVESLDLDNAEAYDHADGHEAFAETDTFTLNSVGSTGQVDVAVTNTDSSGSETDHVTMQETGYSDSNGTLLEMPMAQNDPSSGYVYEYFSDTPQQPTLTTDSQLSSADTSQASYTSSTYEAYTTTTVGNASASSSETACFCSGTLIRTPRGDVAVETLQAGDEVVTASGAVRPIVWIGSQKIISFSNMDAAQAHALTPVLISRDAFAQNMPDRDLLVSPGHAIAVPVMDSVFIQAVKLVNGATIRRAPCESTEYWHVELESHDVLLSNGLPSERYLDVGNRNLFATLSAGTQVEPATLDDYALPLVLNGPEIAAVRERLAARARALGWNSTTDKDEHLMVDGQRVEPAMDGDRACFIFPAGAREVALVSNAFRPAECGAGEDARELGIYIRDMHVSDGLFHDAAIDMDAPAIAAQCHDAEQQHDGHWRWTKGSLNLDPSLWAGCRGHVVLRLHRSAHGGQYWTAPAADAANIVSFRASA
ncbi:Hint domain-containing protein [Komagataeibacter oboediens]|uniref:Hint domain-containing protein n=1 Tax=Komagataeibacter oboediens TaxID=65958 RepID=UPI0023DC8E24|nr:Hint domain-containing protein [Komagataeibacter oboediens]WEQ52651.1 Hint domain-containing protein [Komagataeibacter oboediens]